MSVSSVSSAGKKQQVDTQSQGDKKPAGANFDDQLSKLKEEHQALMQERDSVRETDQSQSSNNDQSQSASNDQGSDNSNTTQATNEKGGNEDEKKASLQTRADLVKVQIQYMEQQQAQSQGQDDKSKKVEV